MGRRTATYHPPKRPIHTWLLNLVYDRIDIHRELVSPKADLAAQSGVTAQAMGSSLDVLSAPCEDLREQCWWQARARTSERSSSQAGCEGCVLVDKVRLRIERNQTCWTQRSQQSRERTYSETRWQTVVLRAAPTFTDYGEVSRVGACFRPARLAKLHCMLPSLWLIEPIRWVMWSDSMYLLPQSVPEKFLIWLA